MVWTPPKTWDAGSTLVAADLNKYVRDNLLWLTPEIPVDPVADLSFAAATGWNVNQLNVVRSGWTVTMYVLVTRTGAAIAAGATGDVANTPMATIGATAWQPAVAAGLTAGATGRMAAATIPTTGAVTLTAVAPGANVANGEQLSFGGTYVMKGA